MSSDDPQPVLKAAATDGHRLARVTVPRPDGAEGMPDVIIPRKCVAELRKLLDEVDGSVGVSLSADQDPLRSRPGGAHLEADRRHLPRLQPRDPDRQRQDPQDRSAQLRGRRRSRLDDRHRKDPRGEDGARSRQDHAVGDQPGKRHRGRGSARRIYRAAVRDRLQRALSARHPRARSKAIRSRSTSPTPPRRR